MRGQMRERERYIQQFAHSKGRRLERLGLIVAENTDVVGRTIEERKGGWARRRGKTRREVSRGDERERVLRSVQCDIL